jgi:hypothetical protein
MVKVGIGLTASAMTGVLQKFSKASEFLVNLRFGMSDDDH